jgi:hypothetical protein
LVWRVNAESSRFVNRRVLWVSGALALLLVLAIGAFLALRGGAAPLWLTRHPASPSATP